MAEKIVTGQGDLDELAQLKGHLEETEATLNAIRQYMVDAFVVDFESGTQVLTLSNADFPYRMMVESMNEGAITLIPDGTIFYCNPRFAEMVQDEVESLIGTQFRDLIRPEEAEVFNNFFAQAKSGARAEFGLKQANENYIAVQLSIHQFAGENTGGISILATDLTERIQAEEKIRALAAQLTVAEQQERQRISQILHDDLQQSLFAIKTQLSFLTNDGDEGKVSVAARNELKQIQRWLSEVIGTTRSLSIDLNPVVLQGEGLYGALAWLCSQMKEQQSLQVQLDAKDNLNILDHQIRLLLFQTVRELLFNIVKHAGTSEAHITLEKFNEKAQITVSDSGKGFDVGAVMNDLKNAHGLLVVQDRLNLLGCSMEITSAPGQGTRIVIQAPFGGV
jgi:two-component system, NarL family, sensor kinase